MMLDDIVRSMREERTRQSGGLLDQIKRCTPQEPLSDAERTKLSSLLAEAYQPPFYSTSTAAKAAASQHAKGIWALSNGLGDPYARNLEAYLTTVGPNDGRRLPAADSVAGELCDALLQTLSPRRMLLLQMRYGVGPFERQHDTSFGLASYHAIAEIVGLDPREVRTQVSNGLRRCRHPSRSSVLDPYRRAMVQSVATSGPLALLRDILLPSES